MPPARGRELAELIPGAHLELIPSCGHLLTTDAEDQSAGAILGHLTASDPRQTRTRYAPSLQARANRAGATQKSGSSQGRPNQ